MCEQQELLRYSGHGITTQGLGHAQNRLICIIGDSEHVCSNQGVKPPSQLNVQILYFSNLDVSGFLSLSSIL